MEGVKRIIMIKREDIDENVLISLNKRNENWQIVEDIKNDLVTQKEDYANYKVSNNLKVASVERELNNYKSTMAGLNPNQEAKQTATGYGVVSLPKNSANGQVSSVVKGLTATNLVNGKGDSLLNWDLASGVTIENGYFKFDTSVGFSLIKYSNFTNGDKWYISMEHYASGLPTRNIIVGFRDNSNIGMSNFITLPSTNTVKAKVSGILTIAATTSGRLQHTRTVGDDLGFHYIKNEMAINLTRTFGAGNEPTKEQCDKIFANYFDGTKSTISASRLKSVGKNLFNKNIKIIYGKALDDDNTEINTPTFAYTFDFIKVKPNTSYTRNTRNRVYYYDINKNLIKRSPDVNTFITPANCYYIRLQLYNKTGITDDYFTTGEGSTFQLEKGTATTPYEPYTESTQYLPSVGELRSLPNGVKDEIRVSGGNAKLVKRVSGTYKIKESDIGNFLTRTDKVHLNTEDISTFIPNSIPITSNSSIDNNLFIQGYTEVAYTPDGVAMEKVFSRANNQYIYFDFPIGTTLEQAKVEIVGLELTYQLAEPIITPIEASGTLLSNPSGTVYVEPVVADAGIYNAGISVLHEDLPIDYIEGVSKVDFTTGLETELDAAQCVMAGDKLSFTHPSLVSGDIVFFTYFYDLESTLGETTIEYYDSRHTLKDSVTGKFYKIVPTVADGVLTNGLVEV